MEDIPVEITEVRVKLLAGRSDRLRAFCSMTIDDEFVVHDLRVIDGRKGMFVAMPSRKLSDNCPECGGKNHLRAEYCNDCGAKLDGDRADDRDKYHVDVAHPIETPCREKVQSTVLEAYREEAAKSDEMDVELPEEESTEMESDEVEEVEEVEEAESVETEQGVEEGEEKEVEIPEFEPTPESGEEEVSSEPEPEEEPEPETHPEPEPAAEAAEAAEPETSPESVSSELEEETEKDEEEESVQPAESEQEDEDEGGFGAGIF
ncbi:MAG: septation protein SpoVG family protein [Planctomycetota bacterium]